MSAQGKSCPYGWHASPERPTEVVEVITRDVPQDQTLIKQQLQIALEQIRGLREENQSLKMTSPRMMTHAITPPSIFHDEGNMINIVSNIDKVIKHHEQIAAAETTSAAFGVDGTEVLSPARPANFIQLKLDQANQTIDSQKSRITELEERLAQREIHIDTLTKSLIDLGQHNSKLQSQVVSIVNEPSRSEPQPLELPPSNALQEIQEKQSLIKKLDEKVESGVQNMKKLHLAANPSTGTPDYKGIMCAIEEHKTRADQIVSLNKQSMSMLRSYYLNQGEEVIAEELPMESQDISLLRSTSAGESPAAQLLLASGRWVRDYDKSLGKYFYYSPSENRISWDIEVEVLREEASYAANNNRAPSPAPPTSLTRPTSLATMSPAVPPRPTPYVSVGEVTSLA